MYARGDAAAIAAASYTIFDFILIWRLLELCSQLEFGFVHFDRT
jgi:hypothetical protein